jgi:hypothetical protein
MNITEELRRLSRLTLAELRDEYERVSGEPVRSNNRPFLIKRISWRLQAAASGGLTERARARALELARDQDLRVRPRPEVHAAYGEVVAPKAASNLTLPPVGSLLTRMYKGRRLEVRVLERGFEFDGRVFPSLTAVAKEATGSDWNGRLFFGLTGRGGNA